MQTLVRTEIPECLQMLWLQALHEVDRQRDSFFGSAATYLHNVRIAGMA